VRAIHFPELPVLQLPRLTYAEPGFKAPAKVWGTSWKGLQYVVNFWKAGSSGNLTITLK